MQPVGILAQRYPDFFNAPPCILSMAGLVAIDSLGSFQVSPSMSSTPYWTQLSLQRYGLHTAIHVVNGLRFLSPKEPSGRVCTFEEAVLCHSRRKYAWCLLVSGGNDVYAYKMAPNIAECIKSMNAALTLAPQVLVVFGGSSSIWRYGGDWGSEYDRRIEDVMKAVACPIGASIITGAKELQLDVSDIVDRIGHVRYGIGAMKVIEALKTWSYSFEEPARAKL